MTLDTVKYTGYDTPTTLTLGQLYTVKETVTYAGVPYIAVNEDPRIFPAEDFKEVSEQVTPIKIGNTISFTYTNWRGETAQRKVKVIDFAWGHTPWHDEPQWLMLALDFEKNDGRKFAMRDMSEVVLIEEEALAEDIDALDAADPTYPDARAIVGVRIAIRHGVDEEALRKAFGDKLVDEAKERARRQDGR